MLTLIAAIALQLPSTADAVPTKPFDNPGPPIEIPMEGVKIEHAILVVYPGSMPTSTIA